ncbi:MAG: prolyl aminopeptidase [Alphaproteobacteria bacterium]|nr:prolyl aminopeptidase [Alphaproteobacteria bacterium]
MPIYSFYPEIEPFKTGFLSVDTHNIYWEISGNPTGTPVVFLHGGPGVGSSPASRRFFDPKFYQIIVFDQRGCGRSTPWGSLEKNTTQDLIEDIEKLKLHLSIKKWIVFGGSWGSCLGLAYAEKYPESCLALVVRGIFLGTKSESDWFFNGMKNIAPDIWNQFINFLPVSEQKNFLDNYYKRLIDPDPTIHLPAAKSWFAYETRCCTLLPNQDFLQDYDNDHAVLPLARIEAHFFINDFFMKDKALLDNLEKIQHIPTTIIQGRYDIVCPPISAHLIAQNCQHRDYIVVENAGHTAAEPGIKSHLIETMEKLKLVI